MLEESKLSYADKATANDIINKAVKSFEQRPQDLVGYLLLTDEQLVQIGITDAA